MYSGEYDACDVTLSVYPHRASLKNMPDHGGNRTYDLWNTSPMLCQLSYAVWSVRVCDISEQNLVPSTSMLSNNNHDFSVLVLTASATVQRRCQNAKRMHKYTEMAGKVSAKILGVNTGNETLL